MSTVLKARQLTKRFGNFTAVEDVSFEAAGGEIFGLLGPNGAGKTTTIRMLASILAPTSGSAEVCGFDVIGQSASVRRNVGLLTTDIGVYERFSGRENLRYFGELYGMTGNALEQRIAELGTLLDMNEFLDRRAGKYSTGMKQKLALARSVIHDPRVVIFDEPTLGLDVLASQTVLNFMRQLKQQGRCVVFSTHQMPDAEKLCDRVAIIHKARLLVIDTVKGLRERTKTTDLEDAFLKLVAAS